MRCIEINRRKMKEITNKVRHKEVSFAELGLLFFLTSLVGWETNIVVHPDTQKEISCREIADLIRMNMEHVGDMLKRLVMKGFLVEIRNGPGKPIYYKLGDFVRYDKRCFNVVENGFIYFIQGKSGGAIKIGFTTDLEKRLKNLQTGYPDDLVILHAEPGDFEDEVKYHELFKKYKLQGEWYRPDQEIYSKINELKAHLLV